MLDNDIEREREKAVNGILALEKKLALTSLQANRCLWLTVSQVAGTEEKQTNRVFLVKAEGKHVLVVSGRRTWQAKLDRRGVPNNTIVYQQKKSYFLYDRHHGKRPPGPRKTREKNDLRCLFLFTNHSLPFPLHDRSPSRSRMYVSPVSPGCPPSTKPEPAHAPLPTREPARTHLNTHAQKEIKNLFC